MLSKEVEDPTLYDVPVRMQKVVHTGKEPFPNLELLKVASCRLCGVLARSLTSKLVVARTVRRSVQVMEQKNWINRTSCEHAGPSRTSF